MAVAVGDFILSHQIEAELLKPAPRHIRRRPENGRIWWLFLPIPHVLAGFVVTVFALHILTILLFGVIVRARVTGFYPLYGGQQPAHFVSYDYSLGSTTYHGQSDITDNVRSKMNIGTQFDVKVLAITPAYNAIPLLENGAGFITVFSIPFALFWNVLIFLGYRRFYWPLLLSRKMVQRGTPTTGAIQQKEIEAGHQPHYRVRFGYVADPNLSPSIYQLVAGGPPLNPLRGEMYVTKSQYDSVKAGEWVTVLFDPRNPKHAVVYPLSRHIAV